MVNLRHCLRKIIWLCILYRYIFALKRMQTEKREGEREKNLSS